MTDLTRTEEIISVPSLPRSKSPPPFTQPAEWEEHQSCWLAWPSHEDLWKEDLEPARKEFIALCRAIGDPDPAIPSNRGETLDILVPDEKQLALAMEALRGLRARFHCIPFGDIWLRDTAPIFVRAQDGALTAARFDFNGWGGKYELEHDDAVAENVVKASGIREKSYPFILEGGSIEVDGQGTALTTRQCLLNPNRNRGVGQREIEVVLRESLGITKTIWLNRGLVNDHTDGHIDTLARFAGPGLVLCMEARTEDDPNRLALHDVQRGLEEAIDAQGRKLKIITIPSPGRIENEEGKILAASYLNFYIANTTVVVPIYDSPFDAEAVSAISRWFPGRKTIGLSARAILTGGGAFHCITQQQPLTRLRRGL
ncbi:MAG TPA: agmatine deiminase family protein [Bdellovibrionota bacterium]|nr:agmatine deiminase family protein [Bdellovibrionota bacterium]